MPEEWIWDISGQVAAGLVVVVLAAVGHALRRYPGQIERHVAHALVRLAMRGQRRSQWAEILSGDFEDATTLRERWSVVWAAVRVAGNGQARRAGMSVLVPVDALTPIARTATDAKIIDANYEYSGNDISVHTVFDDGTKATSRLEGGHVRINYHGAGYSTARTHNLQPGTFVHNAALRSLLQELEERRPPSGERTDAIPVWRRT